MFEPWMEYAGGDPATLTQQHHASLESVARYWVHRWRQQVNALVSNLDVFQSMACCEGHPQRVGAGGLAGAADQAEPLRERPLVHGGGDASSLVLDRVLGMRSPDKSIQRAIDFDQAVEDGVAGQTAASHVLYVDVMLSIGLTVSKHQARELGLDDAGATFEQTRSLKSGVQQLQFIVNGCGTPLHVDAQLHGVPLRAGVRTAARCGPLTVKGWSKGDEGQCQQGTHPPTACPHGL